MKYLIALFAVLLLSNVANATTLLNRMAAMNHLLPSRTVAVEPGTTESAITRQALAGVYPFDSDSSPVGAPLPTRTPTATLSNSLGL